MPLTKKGSEIKDAMVKHSRVVPSIDEVKDERNRQRTIKMMQKQRRSNARPGG